MTGFYMKHFLYDTQYWADMGFAKNLNFKLTPPNTKNINHLSANPQNGKTGTY